MTTSKCIEVTCYRDPKGYGQQYYEGKLRLSHRVAYVKHRGLPISAIDGKVVMHTCDNPSCINPDHLKLGTIADNNKDKADKKRDKRYHIRVLTDADAATIRETYIKAHPQRGCRALARRFGCSMGTVQKILKGVTYR